MGNIQKQAEGAGLTVAPLSVAPGVPVPRDWATTLNAGIEFCSYPKPGERLLGISRTGLIELAASGKIRDVTIRKPGRLRGKRILYLPSLRLYLHGLMLKQDKVRATSLMPPCANADTEGKT